MSESFPGKTLENNAGETVAQRKNKFGCLSVVIYSLKLDISLITFCNIKHLLLWDVTSNFSFVFYFNVFP